MTDTMREALEPFAKLADRYDPPEGDDAKLCWLPAVPTLGDLRRARAALAAAPQPGQQDQRLVWIIENTSQVRVRDLALDILNHPKAAAPQPAPADREALVEVIAKAMLGRPPGNGMVHAIADALLARGLRLPGEDETMAWAVVGEDGALVLEMTSANKVPPARLHEGERVVRVAIRVVEGGDDAA